MRGLRILELGNQHAGWTIQGPVKVIMTWLGAEHTSIDINGLDGSIVTDLSEPLHHSLKGRFDLVTNAGTTEHVNSPARDFRDQWQVFKSIHDALAETGAMMHVIPDEGGQHANCGYVYTHSFLPDLARCCGYEVLESYDSRSDQNHMACLMLKTASSRFPEYDDFMKLGGILRT
jgi:hypothetical protein